jgi:Flp pilus assembly protein protease CpaA
MLHTLGYDPSLSKLLLVQMLVISSITDLLWKRISNRLLLASLFGVAILSLLNAPETPGISQSLLGFFGCFAMALTTYLLLRGGEGDVKLLAVIGAFLGFDHGIEAWVFGYLLAFPIALGATLLHRDRKRFTLPMAPFLALGTVLTRIG